MTKKVILVVLDGWGSAPSWGGNAVELAETLNFDRFWRKYPHLTLRAAEEAVGLPRHEPGNSEVGHLNLGSGEVVRQNLPGISKEIENGNFFTNSYLKKAVTHARQNKSNLHLLGLVSTGGIHSHIEHLFALLDFVKKENFRDVYIHIITDGRDTEPMKALSYLEELEKKIKDVGLGQIASVTGRFYGMDRDNRWERIQKAYDLLTLGLGPKSETPEKAVSAAYRQGQYDEFIIPTAIEQASQKFTPVKNNDSVIFFNFRADRTQELTRAFVLNDFNHFKREIKLSNLYFATFAYHEKYEEALPVQVVFEPKPILNPLAAVVAKAGLRQFHIAETEKYAHVTYFFNGGKEKPYEREERLLIPSPRVATYDLVPEMSAAKVADEAVRRDGADFTIINFANPDMVGHSGNLRATVKACEFVDRCLGKVVEAGLGKQKTIIVTADHGNAEQMLNPNTGEPHKEHTINPVPLMVISGDASDQIEFRDLKRQAILADVAPTILKIMDLPIPKEMTGKSLF